MAITGHPTEPERDYARISCEALNALVDMMDRRASGTVEIHFAQGGIAKIYATEKKTYK